MKRAIIITAVFFGVIGASCGLAWIGGFNFDKRTPAAAMWAFMTLVMACMLLLGLWCELEDKQ